MTLCNIVRTAAVALTLSSSLGTFEALAQTHQPAQQEEERLAEIGRILQADIEKHFSQIRTFEDLAHVSNWSGAYFKLEHIRAFKRAGLDAQTIALYAPHLHSFQKPSTKAQDYALLSQAKVPVSYLKALHEPNEIVQKYSAETIAHLWAHKVPTEYALEFRKKMTGYFSFDFKDIAVLFNGNVPIGYGTQLIAAEISLGGNEVATLWSANVPSAYAINAKKSFGRFSINADEIAELWKAGIPDNHFYALSAVRDKGIGPRKKLSEAMSQQEGISPDYVRTLAQLFVAADDIIQMAKDKIPLDYLVSLADSKYGMKLLPFDSHQVYQFHEYSVPAQFIHEQRRLFNSPYADNIFDAGSIVNLFLGKYSVDEVKTSLALFPEHFQAKGSAALQLLRDDYLPEFKQSLGGRLATRQDFDGFMRSKSEQIIRSNGYIDVPQDRLVNGPDNYLVVLPTSDWNGAFHGKSQLKWLDSLRKAGKKVYVTFASSEDDVYLAAGQFTDIDTLILAGHGSKGSIAFGDLDPRLYRQTQDERAVLDLNDLEIPEKLNMVRRNVILYSCSTADGDSNNFATKFSTWLPHVNVYAATSVAVNVLDISYIPSFNVTMINRRGSTITTWLKNGSPVLPFP